MKDSVWDVAVVGAGAAGLAAAIHAGRAGLKVLLLDSKEKIGAKILMSGGTRCNLTNEKVTVRDFNSDSPRAVRNILAAYPSAKAVEFFGGLGVKVVLEPGGKYFPSTHSGRTVLEALVREADRVGVRLETGKKMESLKVPGTFCFWVSGDGFSFTAQTVLLTTGGLSYPGTGSDGTGYKIAQDLGHRLVDPIPSLTPLKTEDADWNSLSGLSLEVRLTLGDVSFEGPMLFTHTGFSGPAALNVSRHWIRENTHGTRSMEYGKKILVKFLPGESEEGFRKALQAVPQKGLKKYLSEKLPERFADVLLGKLEIPPGTVLGQLRREDRTRLVRFLFHYELPVTGTLGFEKAEVTAGGVDFRDVDDKTLESKRVPGLFFAGEILDVDGRIGGFNFQWAWSSAYVAAASLVKRAKCLPSKSNRNIV